MMKKRNGTTKTTKKATRNKPAASGVLAPDSHAQYEGTALLADPVHEYINFTVPAAQNTDEVTEKELIDSTWVQRLRYVYQLQSARWVYPTAEHSRFQHSLGAMHVAGRFARHLYKSVKETVGDVPSAAYIEELLRVSALLHDVGHGPFCHFFDDHFLDEYGATHEIIGQAIIREKLGNLIRKIRRSPSGPFRENERLDPDQIAFLILKDPHKDSSRYPPWLSLLQPLLGGIYTADNLDYVLRDSFMCGVAVGPIDLSRLIHYTFFTRKGLTLHRAGLGALQMFLNARSYLYSNVYYHRTTRAIDLHLRDIFRATLKQFFPYHPLQQLDRYADLTDWSLIEGVRGWKGSRSKEKRNLYGEWQKILQRQPMWKMAYETVLPTSGIERGRIFMDEKEIEERIRKTMPPQFKKVEFRVDMANQDPRPLNPLSMGEFQIHVYDPSSQIVSKEDLTELFKFIPAKIAQCRIFARSHQHDRVLAEVARKVLGAEQASSKTNL
jgi:HD superfamily phosphohydrolase